MKYLKLKKRIKDLEEQNKTLSWLKFKSRQENEKLKLKIKELEEESKQITINNVNVSAEDLAKEVARALNKSEEKEHKCTPECFGKHVIKAIQKDYESCPVVFKANFIKYWYDNLSAFYPWLESLYIIDEKIYFNTK